MSSIIEVTFKARDVDNLISAFESIGSRAEKMSARVGAAGQRAIQTRVQAEKQGLTTLEQLLGAHVRAEERAAKDGVKARTQAEKDATRAAKTEASERERVLREEVRIKNAINAIALRDWQRDEREKTRISERESSARERLARATGRTVGGAFNRVVGTAGRVAAGVAAIGGSMSLYDSMRAGISEEKTAGVIFRGAEKLGGFTNQREVQQLARATAISTGGTTEDILGGLDKFVRVTGDLGAAKNMLQEMAKLSAATGTSFEDMGLTTANVYAQLNDSKKTMEVMRALAAQGKAGAIDIKDLGQYGGRLASSAAQFSGDIGSNIETFGVIAQLARKFGGATDAAEATMALQHIGSDVAKKSESFADIGLNVFADKGHTTLRSAEDIIRESIVKTHGDVGALEGLFGERSMRAVRGSQIVYARAGGGSAGEAAIRAQFSELRASKLSSRDVDAGVRSRLAENDAKLNQATEQLHAAINDKLLPLLPELINRFTELIPAIQSVIDFFVGGSVWAGVGKAAAIALALEIAKAGISGAVSAAITRAAGAILGGGAVSGTAGLAIGTGEAILGTAGATTAATGLGAAEVTGGSLAAGLGMLGGGAAGLAGIVYRMFSRESAGSDTARGLIAQGTSGSAEERAARLASVTDLISRADTSTEAMTRFERTGQHSNADDRAIADLEARGAAKSLADLRREADDLKASLGGATDAARQLASVQPDRSKEPSPNHAP